MKFVRKALLPAVGVVAFALLVAIVSPRAVQAVTAAFVQIVNTPTTAVPAVQAPAANQIYHSFCYQQYLAGSMAVCYHTTVPGGKTLFIETVSVRSTSDHGVVPTFAQVEIPTSPFSVVYVPLSSQGSTGGLDYFVGTVAARIPAEAYSTPNCRALLGGNSGNGEISCQIIGYLVPAQ